MWCRVLFLLQCPPESRKKTFTFEDANRLNLHVSGHSFFVHHRSIDCVKGFHLLHADISGISISPDLQPVEVAPTQGAVLPAFGALGMVVFVPLLLHGIPSCMLILCKYLFWSIDVDSKRITGSLNTTHNVLLHTPQPTVNILVALRHLLAHI